MALDFFVSMALAFGIIFIMELGDKTQLVILTLSTKGFKAKELAFGAMTGFAIIVSLGGAIATIISVFFPIEWITFVSSFVFITLGIYSFVQAIKSTKKLAKDSAPGSLTENEEKRFKKTSNSFLAGLIAILTMELGDKTQVATIVLAAASTSFVGTLIGAWGALSSLAIIGAYAGKWLSEKVPKAIMSLVSGSLFIVVGVIMLFLATAALFS